MRSTNKNKSGYKKTPLGWIPNDWEVRRLSFFIKEFEGGKSVNSEDRSINNNGEFGIMKTSAVYGGKFNPNENKVILLNELPKVKLHPKADAILVSRMNTPELVGETAYVDKDYPNLYLPDRIWQTIYHEDIEVCPRWLSYVFSSDKMRLILKSMATGTSDSMKNISKRALLKVSIATPTIEERERIAHILTKWDRAIEKLSQLILAKELRKKWLTQMLLTGKKRLKGFGKDKWVKLSAGEVFKSVTVKGFDSEELLSATQDKGIIPRSMLEARVTMPTGATTSFKLVEKGDFVISLRSFQGGLEYSYYRGIVSPAYTVLKPEKKINEEFYKQYYKSYDFIGHLATAVIGIRDGKQINYDDYCLVKIPYPSFEEQTAIANVLLGADKELQLLNKKLEKMKEQKKGLMQQLLTGKKRLKLNELKNKITNQNGDVTAMVKNKRK